MEPVEETKRRKLNGQEQLRCGHFIVKKNRYCPLGRKAGQEYCVHHGVVDAKDERIPCPLDPKHSIWKKSLKKHLEKCNSKPKVEHEYWYELDYNVNTTNTSEASIDDDANDLTAKYIKVLDKLSFPELETKIRHHDGLNQKLSKVSIQKHPIQQSSLIGNMKAQGLLDASHFYIEFGCGKAELSRYINRCVIEDLDQEKISPTYGFGLVDRGLNRMKNDSKIVADTVEHGSQAPQIKRTRIDIKDLNLDKFLQDISPEKVVGVSKHLCGAATDLTIKSILNSDLTTRETFQGMVIAMCCRHVCDYNTLLPESKQYLASKGFASHQAFAMLKKFASWAVCGRKKDQDVEEDTSSELKDEETHSSGLNYDQRELLGLKARRLIDESRLYALEKLLPNYKPEMFLYAEKQITLENVCLSVTKR